VRRLTNDNAHQAADWFASWAARELPSLTRSRTPVVLIPVPSSGTVVGTREVSRAADLARRIASRLAGVRVLDVLRWTGVMTPAHQGGPRFADELYPYLAVTVDDFRTETYVLVDDLFSSGGHFRASARALFERGATVWFAIGAGHTVTTPLQDPFAVPDQTYEDYEP
jgi:predicted amidophosphoribosyltransferase